MFYNACLFDLQRKVMAYRERTQEMFIRDWNYSTCWIFGDDGMRGWNRSKRHRTLGELAHANSQEWRSAH
jgi:hypothetical protein